MGKLKYELNPVSKKIDGCAWSKSGSFSNGIIFYNRSGENGCYSKNLESKTQSFRPILKIERGK